MASGIFKDDRKEGAKSFTITLDNDKKYRYLQITIEMTSIFESLELNYVKLELGSYATPFVPHLYGEELALCQRYYQVRTTNNISNVDIRPSMRTKPEIIALGNNMYGYDAEIY